MLGNTSTQPDVSVPMAWNTIIGPAEGTGGLNVKEVWLYWDTGPLVKFMKEDVVAFRTHNPAEGK